MEQLACAPRPHPFVRHRLVPLLLPLLAILAAASADASLVLAGSSETSGTGLGAVDTVLTVHATPSGSGEESGCVAWDGSGDVVGPAACPSGIAGGDEQQQTRTRSLGELGLTSASSLRVVFNGNEPRANAEVRQIDLDHLELTIFFPDGSVCFASGPSAPVRFPETFPGTGTSGFVFVLDAEQAAAAQPCFADADNRIGLAAALSNASGGPETFFLADAGNLSGPAADLELTKVDDADPVEVGDRLTYTLVATNAGPNAATGVTISDTLPGSLVDVAVASPDGECTVSDRIVECSIGDLAAGEVATVTITGTPTVAGTITNSAVVAGDQPDPDTADNVAFEETGVLDNGLGGNSANVDLSIVKSDSPDPVGVGQTLTYRVTVSNLGSVLATGVTVTDFLPAGVRFEAATVTLGSGSCTSSGRVALCTFGELAPGESAEVLVEVTPLAIGTITNLARVTGDQPDGEPADNAASEDTEVVGSDRVLIGEQPIEEIPTLGEWGLMLLAGLLAAGGLMKLRRG